jgi:histidinol-phosphate aminotransferase
MSRYWTDLVRELTPYVPGEQPRTGALIKLNTNENPYPPSPGALAQLASDVGTTLRRYPDPSSTALRQAVAGRLGLAVDQVFAGNGSDEVLALCFLAFFKGRGRLRYPDVSYSFYPVWSRLFETSSEPVSLADDFSLDPRGYGGASSSILFPNPNAPTGMALSIAAIETCLGCNPDHVVAIDEAYVEFGAESAVPLLENHPNLLVVQTLSKSHGLAGLRIGFALGSPELITGLERVKSSFNSYPIDRVAERVAIAAIEDEAHFSACRDRIVATREWTAKQLQLLDFSVLPSRANFVFVRHATVRAKVLLDQLRQRGILVRHFDLPRIDQHLRISIGTDEEMQQLLASLREILVGC